MTQSSKPGGLENWLRYRRELKEWRKRRPYSSFRLENLSDELRTHQVARELDKWEQSKPKK